jgi:hypothetical protein
MKSSDRVYVGSQYLSWRKFSRKFQTSEQQLRSIPGKLADEFSVAFTIVRSRSSTHTALRKSAVCGSVALASPERHTY